MPIKTYSFVRLAVGVQTMFALHSINIHTRHIRRTHMFRSISSANSDKNPLSIKQSLY